MHPDLVLILARQRQEEQRTEAQSERARLGPRIRSTDPAGVRGRAVRSLRSLADRLEAGQPRRI
jgi:hypothetical protein